MKNIILARLDDRLIHGQITIGWLKKIKVDSIIIIDKALRDNDFLANITKKSAPENLNVTIYNEEEFIEYYYNEKKEDILILAKNPKVYENIIFREKIIKEINLGNIGSKLKSRKITKNIYLTEKEEESIKNMINVGTEIYVQMLPEERKIKVEKLL